MGKLYDPARAEIKLGDYAVAPATALSDVALHPRVQDYRRTSGSRMMPLDQEDMIRKMPTADYHVSRKIDGEFTVVVYRDGEAITVNPGGTVRVGLPCLVETAAVLKKAKIKEAMIAAELYVARPDGKRPRVHDVVQVARGAESKDDLQTLSLAVFDLISINEQTVDTPFSETWKQITDIFEGGTLIHPVESQPASKAEEVKVLFEKWVEEEGAEGVVARSETAGTFKIKPRHTLDAVVLGFTESTDDRQGMLHDMLLGTVRADGAIHVLCRVGGGFSDDERRALLSDLKDMIVESEYTEVSGDYVAYQMVKPDWVIEISCLDLISQTTRGGSINRMVLNWDDDASMYRIIRRLPCVSVISPQFIRRREDKSVHPKDVAIQQVADIVDVPMVDRDASQLTLPKSEVLRRECYTKELKGETMVRKFLMWQTNKEDESEDFPKYVIPYTDFSPNRKTPLSRDVRISNSVDQIGELWEALKEANIKKGWVKYGSHPADTEDEPEEKPAKKKAAKKKTAKKAAKKKKASKKKD